MGVREAAKKSYFTSGLTTKALTPPPLELSGHSFFRTFRASSKPLPPPPALSSRITSGGTFFAASLTQIKI